MVVMRQKNQLELAFQTEQRSEAPKPIKEGTEAIIAEPATESPTLREHLMEEVCEASNLKQALRRVKANKGSPGIDGISVDELPGYLKEHWPTIRQQLLAGTYKPQPVKRVEIEKPDGGVRKLGIPTALDRFIQQALLQVLGRLWEGEYGGPQNQDNFSATFKVDFAPFISVVLSHCCFSIQSPKWTSAGVRYSNA